MGYVLWNFGMSSRALTPFQVRVFWKTGPHFCSKSECSRSIAAHPHSQGRVTFLGPSPRANPWRTRPLGKKEDAAQRFYILSPEKKLGPLVLYVFFTSTICFWVCSNICFILFYYVLLICSYLQLTILCSNMFPCSLFNDLLQSLAVYTGFVFFLKRDVASGPEDHRRN